MDQSGDSSFIAERNARVNARSRASRIGLPYTAPVDTMSTLDQSTVSVHSSFEASHVADFSSASDPIPGRAHARSPCIGLDAASNGVTSMLDRNTVSAFPFAFVDHQQLQLQRRPTVPDLVAQACMNCSDELPSLMSLNADWAPPHQMSYNSFVPTLQRDSWSRRTVPAPIGSQRRRGAALVAPPPGLMLPPYANALLDQQQAAPRLRLRTISIVSRNSSTDSSDVSRASGSSRGAQECTYCLSVNKLAFGHNKHNCPILMTLPPCRICHASGKYNHTESHCPDQEKTILDFIPKNRRRTHTF